MPPAEKFDLKDKKQSSTYPWSYSYFYIADALTPFAKCNMSSESPDSHKIDMNDINQGALGDCFFMAALIGLADKDRSAIEKAIISNADGTHKVVFPGFKASMPGESVASSDHDIDGCVHGSGEAYESAVR